MQKIIPHLWFDKEAIDAAHFYASVFPDSKVKFTGKLHSTPSGDVDMLAFDVFGMEIQAINAGPYFKMNPSISFMINFNPSKDTNARKSIDEIWEKLSVGGEALMPLDKYPFSERYGWIKDRYGVTWQLIYTNPNGEERPRIIPSLLFTQNAYGKAEEASQYYLSVFKDSEGGTQRGALAKYETDMGPNKQGTTMFTDFKLAGQWFVAMDGGGEHAFTFNEGISLIISCETQEEMDYFTEKLSAVPESEQCGWVKDKFGVSWQIVPKIMDEVMRSGDQAKIDRVTNAFMPMKRLNIAALKQAAEGK